MIMTLETFALKFSSFMVVTDPPEIPKQYFDLKKQNKEKNPLVC